MTDPREREILIEQAAGAWRPRRADGTLASHPAWHDLDVAGREEAHAIAVELRRIEAALDANGLSSTAKAVLARVRGYRGAGGR
jgi:hypothetical protein